jgi:hypothetical protein
MQGLNRKELEDYVIELYHDQKKTFREIQKIVRKSPRDIRAILDKVEPERASLSESSRAYQMFEKSSTPIQVAIALNLRENEVSGLYREYWNLNGIYHLKQIYDEVKDDIWSVIELHRRTKIEGLTPQQISRILKTTTILEHNNRNLEYEQARLEVGNKQAAQTYQQLTDSILKDNKTIEENDYTISQRKREIENLNIEKIRLENSIKSIRLNNETCINIKQIVKQEIESVVSNPRRLLKTALASLFESSRKHPGRLQALYYNMPSPLSVEQILSDSSDRQDASLYDFGENENEKLLLDEAEQSFSRFVDAITNSCINRMYNDTESLLTLQGSDVNGAPTSVERGNRNILDTRELSEVNFVYNNTS